MIVALNRLCGNIGAGCAMMLTHPISIERGNMRRLIILILTAFSVLGLGISLLAQSDAQTGDTSVASTESAPVWQSGESIRAKLFDAQRLLFGAARADDPASVYTEASAYVDDATQIYTTQLRPLITDASSPADTAIIAALADAQSALDRQDAAAFAAARGRVWTGLLWLSHDTVQAALLRDDVATAQAWLPLREYRQATKVTLVDSPAAQALVDLSRGDISSDEAAVVVGNDLRDTYTFRLRDALNELSSAAADGYATRAAEWAGQAAGYYAILQRDLADRLGQDEATALAAQLTELEAQNIAQAWPAVAASLNDVGGMLAAYQPVELSAEAVAERGRLLLLFLDLTDTEYQNAVRDGVITIPVEYQEATTFMAQSRSVFDELRPIMTARDAAATQQLDALLTDASTTIAALGPRDSAGESLQASIALVQMTLQVERSSGDAAAIFTVIDTLLDSITTSVADGRYDEAERSRIEAYGLLETGPEQRLSNRAPNLSRELEGLFWEGTGGRAGLYTLISQQADAPTMTAAVDHLHSRLNQAESFLGEGVTAPIAAVNSAVIIIREGLEAVLIIGAILAYMFKTGAPRRFVLWVVAGIVAAIALSVVTWVAAQTILIISPAQRELIGGVTSLVAVGVLFYVTNWLFHKVYVVDWMTYVREQADRALNDGRAVGLAALGFTVVFREGLETVLFYQALLIDAEATPVLLGFVVGLVIILAIAWVMLRLSRRIPIRPLFTVTTVLLLMLAFSFTGAGVRELQEASVFSTTLLPWFPENLLLMQFLGLYPTVETLLAQGLFCLLIVLTFTYSRWLGTRDAKPSRRLSTT